MKYIPLGDGHDDHLMVGCRSKSADTVVTRRKATSDISRQETLAVTRVVDTLEESELSWVRRRSGVQGVSEILNGDVSVADDLALRVELLRGGVVGSVSVGEAASLEVLSLDCDREILVGLDGSTVLGEPMHSEVSNKEDGPSAAHDYDLREDRRDHVCLRRNVSHGDAVARTVGDLKSVGEGLP